MLRHIEQVVEYVGFSFDKSRRYQCRFQWPISEVERPPTFWNTSKQKKQKMLFAHVY
ncbi:Uncharacterized protein APZ42_028155 [Daphnia magna]|uniref:Uncharacterized protein n=1 Tax=Daphnia magna TaxID=35525 RepID=A0A0P6AUH1_9CRUS|nr:Uncharacterized protein APZ42_028155 [Daphnia magna]